MYAGKNVYKYNLSLWGSFTTDDEGEYTAAILGIRMCKLKVVICWIERVILLSGRRKFGNSQSCSKMTIFEWEWFVYLQAWRTKQSLKINFSYSIQAGIQFNLFLLLHCTPRCSAFNSIKLQYFSPGGYSPRCTLARERNFTSFPVWKNFRSTSHVIKHFALHWESFLLLPQIELVLHISTTFCLAIFQVKYFLFTVSFVMIVSL